MRKRWLGIPLVLVLGLSVGAYTWWQSPATSTVDHGSRSVSDVLGSETALKPWQTSFFATKIPTTLRTKTSTDTPQYGAYLLTSTSIRISDQVGVTVANLGNNSLDELPAVKLRLNQPDLYTPVQNADAPAGAYAFTREDEYESSVFWQANGKYVAVVASGTSAHRAELQATVQAIVANWTWSGQTQMVQ